MTFGKSCVVSHDSPLLCVTRYRWWVRGHAWRVQVGALVHRFGGVERIKIHRYDLIVRIGRHLIGMMFRSRTIGVFYSDKRSKKQRSFRKRF